MSGSVNIIQKNCKMYTATATWHILHLKALIQSKCLQEYALGNNTSNTIQHHNKSQRNTKTWGLLNQ